MRLRRGGADVALIGYGSSVNDCLAAAEMLELVRAMLGCARNNLNRFVPLFRLSSHPPPCLTFVLLLASPCWCSCLAVWRVCYRGGCALLQAARHGHAAQACKGAPCDDHCRGGVNWRLCSTRDAGARAGPGPVLPGINLSGSWPSRLRRTTTLACCLLAASLNVQLLARVHCSSCAWRG